MPLPAEEPKPEKKTAPRQEKKPKTKPRDPKNTPEVLLPQEEKEQQEMAQLKAMIGLGSAKKTAGPAKAEEKRSMSAKENSCTLSNRHWRRLAPKPWLA